MVAQDGDAPVDPQPSKPDRRRLFVVLAVVIVAAGVLLYANRSQPQAGEEEDGATFRIEYPTHGFAVRLPGNWEIYEQEDPQIVLVAGVSGTQNNVRVRVSPLPNPVAITDDTPESVIAELQAQFDAFIDSGEGVKEVLRRQRIRVSGAHGWQYLYTFTDEATGQEGIHSHIFLLGGTRMYVLVFQALPTSAYGEMAGTFDQILTSFELLRSEASPSPAEEASPSPAE